MPRRELVLDTCALLWLASGGGRLSAEALRAIDRAEFVWVSPISAWEIGLKVRRGALVLPGPVEAWFPAVLEHHRIAIAPLSVEVALAANQLPWHHRDPADRFIIATALARGAAVVTADQAFTAYEGLEVLG